MTDLNVGFAGNLVCGCVAWAAAKTALAPLERVKLLLPVYNTNRLPLGQFVGEMYRTQGAAVFFRGNFVNVVRSAPTPALTLATFHALREPSSRSWLVDVAAGAAAGAAVALPTHPLHVARTEIANNRHAVRSLPAALRRVGVRGALRGVGIAVAGVGVLRGVQLGGYEASKRVLALHSRESTIVRLGLGWLATACAMWLAYPLDTVRRRLMIVRESRLSAIGMASKMLRDEGVVSFWKGASAVRMRAVSGALLLAGFDLCRELYFKMPSLSM